MLYHTGILLYDFSSDIHQISPLNKLIVLDFSADTGPDQKKRPDTFPGQNIIIFYI